MKWEMWGLGSARSERRDVFIRTLFLGQRNRLGGKINRGFVGHFSPGEQGAWESTAWPGVIQEASDKK